MNERYSPQQTKVQYLLSEFNLPLPSLDTFKDAAVLLNQGLPLVKGVGDGTIEYLMNTGFLHPGKFPVLYTSILHDNNYGEFALTTNKDVVSDPNNQVYCIDHGSGYLLHYRGVPVNLEAQMRAMGDYTLDYREFAEFYTFCLAVLADHLPLSRRREWFEGTGWMERARYLKFEVGLPVLQKTALTGIYFRYYEKKPEVPLLTNLKEYCKRSCISYGEFRRTSADPYLAADTITDTLITQHNVPEKFNLGVRLLS